MKPVLSKSDFVRRYKQGEFGNRSPTWDGLADWQRGWNGYGVGRLFHIRNRITGGPTYYNVSDLEIESAWNTLLERGTDPRTLYISEMAPHHLNVIQGEIQQSIRHLDLTYTVVPDLPMRDALSQNTQYADGATAVEILRASFDPSSYDWLEYLLDEYPGHIVEFSTFSRYWGTVPRRNTVIWEVRMY